MRGMMKLYLRLAKGIIFVYDANDRASFDALEQYKITETLNYVEGEMPALLLLANKSDKEKKVPAEVIGY